MPAPSKPVSLVERFINFLSSFGLAAVLLILLLILTWMGTLQQQYDTIYEVQERYFRSAFLVHYVGGKYPIPLVGGYVLLPLLALNLFFGGLMRMRKGASTLGVFVIHIGIVILFAGSFVEDMLSTKGAMQVWEPRPGDTRDTAGSFQSYEEWEVAVIRPDADGSTTEFVIPHGEFDGLGEDDEARCYSAELPFDVFLGDYMENSKLSRNPVAAQGESPYILERQDAVTKEQKDAGRGNAAGLRVRLVEKASGKVHRGVLWGGRGDTFRTTLAGQPWGVTIRKRSWDLPFTIHLTKFIHEVHPGTGMPRRYSSYVTMTPDPGSSASERDVHITMNEPLREDKYTLYQSGWGPQMGAPGRRMHSVFAVVRNPSDQVPLYACIVIGFGLLIHFGRKLVLYLKAEARKRAAAAAAGSAS